MERLLTAQDAAKVLGTTSRFPGRLIAERRIRFVRVGRHLRTPETELQEFIAQGTLERLRLHTTGSGE